MFNGKVEAIGSAFLPKREIEFTAKLAAGKTIEDAVEIAKKLAKVLKMSKTFA